LALLLAVSLACAQSNVQGQPPPPGQFVTAGPSSPTPAPIVPATVAVLATAGSGIPTATPAIIAPTEAQPTPLPEIPGPSTRLAPDTEVVNGPAAAGFDVVNFVLAQGGYLSTYAEPVSGETMTGADIVALVAANYSISPRLLLALLEHQSGWVTDPAPESAPSDWPLGRPDTGRKGLYGQLTWAADTLNQGYYGWRENRLTSIDFAEERVIFDPGLNAGTVALQYFFSHYYISSRTWLIQLGPDGFTGTFQRLFGDPFAGAVEPLVPADLIQLPFSLPWALDETWYFLGGPHGAYETGSAWAALDFAPPGPPAGCAPSNAWIRAAAPGVVARSDHGVLVIDLDYGTAGTFDGFEQTGWSLYHLHVDSRDRAPVGTVVNTGDPIGHPGCEGGAARGAHLHIARKFNGEWLKAAGPLPFDLYGWTPTGGSIEYAGDLVGWDYVLSACECRSSVNAIRVDGR
jgi:hypothetical protein